ncbi:type II toxin-antitoxin system PemK/MazF family toxin [Bacillus thuringiensis]|uniref:type II toxin-antitoxin system PemK/MazF family toxin n=1 Tax=Bacillus thuringiensis TaxID=1428 RepID=UPI0005CECC67|nr:type II toxin-antitoxin system PemK/MazF family toxin [Bacillus thuringiensis]
MTTVGTSSGIDSIDSFFSTDEKKNLIELLNGISTPEQLRKTINKTIRLIENDIKNENKDKHGRYLPSFKRYDVVHCNFTGIGYEWDFPHYAVVWNVDPIFDVIEVIPLTSVIRDEHIDVFSVGKIAGLPKKEQSTILLSDKTRVSRKRIEKVEFKHPKHGMKKVTLPKSWESRIMHGIIATNTHCKTIEEIISNECGVAMIGRLSIYKDLWYKSVQEYHFDSVTGQLSYRLWDKTTVETIQLVFLKIPETTSKDIKSKKLKWLNSRHKSLRSLAAQYFNEIYGINN